MHWSNCASNAKENRFARKFAFKPWKKGWGGGWEKKEKKRQERFPVVIRLPTSNETIADILYEIKIAITFECQAGWNNLPNKIFALRTTRSSIIHLIVLAFGAINLHWYTCLIAIWPIYYPLFLSQKLSKLFSIVEQNCHQHKVLKFGGMATNLGHKTEFSSKASNEWLSWPRLSPA